MAVTEMGTRPDRCRLANLRMMKVGQWPRHVPQIPTHVKVEIPNHQASTDEYLTQLREFAKKSNTTVPTLHGLGLDSTTATATPSQSQTPSNRAIYYDEKPLGRGGFGQARRVIRIDDAK